MGTPEVLAIIWLTLLVGINLARHGEDKQGPEREYNFFYSALDTGAWVGLLWWGGFF